MKKILLAILLLWLSSASPAHADIIPKDMKSIFVSAFIENLAEDRKSVV